MHNWVHLRTLTIPLSICIPCVSALFLSNMPHAECPSHVLRLSSWGQIDHQRWLLPQVVDLLVQPAFALRRQLQIKVEDQTGHDRPHLGVCQVSTYAIPGTEGERLQGLFPIIGELGVVVVQPSFWVVFRGLDKVFLVVEGRPLPDCNMSL